MVVFSRSTANRLCSFGITISTANRFEKQIIGCLRLELQDLLQIGFKIERSSENEQTVGCVLLELQDLHQIGLELIDLLQIGS